MVQRARPGGLGGCGGTPHLPSSPPVSPQSTVGTLQHNQHPQHPQRCLGGRFFGGASPTMCLCSIFGAHPPGCFSLSPLLLSSCLEGFCLKCSFRYRCSEQSGLKKPIHKEQVRAPHSKHDPESHCHSGPSRI